MSEISLVTICHAVSITDKANGLKSFVNSGLVCPCDGIRFGVTFAGVEIMPVDVCVSGSNTSVLLTVSLFKRVVYA